METALHPHLPSNVTTLRSTALEYYRKARAAKEKLRKQGEENAKTVDGMIEIAETVGAAFAVSWVNGKYGNAQTGTPAQFFGFDADLLAAGVLAGAALFDVMGEKYSPHLFTLAGGCAAAWATREGLKLGAAAPATTSTTATTTTIAAAA